MKRLVLITIFFLFASIGNSATWYVRSSGGNDANDGQTFDEGYATLQYAVDATSVTGSVLLICGVFSPTAAIDIDTNLGTEALPLVWRGANASTGADDGSVATINGTNLPATTNLLYFNVSPNHMAIENLTVDGATQYGAYVNANLICVFKNAKFINSTLHGFYSFATTNKIDFEDSEFAGNGGSGYYSTISRGGNSFLRTVSHDNASHGFQVGMASGVVDTFPGLDYCMSYGNGGAGLFADSAANYAHIRVRHSVFAFNTGNGIELENTTAWAFIDYCIFRSNGGFAIDTNGGDVEWFRSITNLCSSNNTPIDINGGVFPGTGHVYANPDFVSEVDGSEDLTPQNTDLKKTVSLPAGAADGELWIGAVQPPEGGGGGGDKWPYPTGEIRE